jgi:leader peptidase (prepilin peptidase)/N-methyltransferase
LLTHRQKYCMSNLASNVTVCLLGVSAGFAGAIWAIVERQREPASRCRQLLSSCGSILAIAASGMVGLAVAMRAGPRSGLPADLALVAVGIPLATVDLAHQRLPRSMVYAFGAAVATAWALAVAVEQPLDRLLRAVLAAAMALTCGLALAVTGGLGAGDVRLAGALGLYLGWYGWTTVLLGFTAALLLALGPAVHRRLRHRAGEMPFGPFLIAGAALAVPW